MNKKIYSMHPFVDEEELEREGRCLHAEQKREYEEEKEENILISDIQYI